MLDWHSNYSSYGQSTITLSHCAGWLRGWVNTPRTEFAQWKMQSPLLWISVDVLWMSSRLARPRSLLHWNTDRFPLVGWCCVGLMRWVQLCETHEPCSQRQEETVLPLSGAEATFSRRMWSPQSYLPSTVLDLLFFLTPPKFLLSQITRILLLTVGNL